MCIRDSARVGVVGLNNSYNTVNFGQGGDNVGVGAMDAVNSGNGRAPNGLTESLEFRGKELSTRALVINRGLVVDQRQRVRTARWASGGPKAFSSRQRALVIE